MKKLILPILAILLLTASCRTPQERARRLIERADRIYPIKQMVDTIVKIDTMLKIDTVFIVRADTVKLTIPVIDENGKTIQYNKTVLKETDKYKITGSTLMNGDLDLTVYIKEQELSFTFWKPFKHTVINNKELIRATKEIKVKGFFWWVGLITVISSSAMILLLVVRSLRKYKVI